MTYVNFRVFEALLEIVVNSFIGDFAQECEVRYSHLFLLGALKDRFLDLGLSPSAGRRVIRIGSIFLAACALGNGLYSYPVSSSTMQPRIQLLTIGDF